MARTALARQLTEIASIGAEAHRRRVTAAQVMAERAERQCNRREFLGLAAKASAVVGGWAGLPGLLRAAPARSGRIVIVGAGLAGLTCAYTLKRAGQRATVYEAASRLGGRCLSRRHFFDDDQVAERGGELIDTGHKALRTLAGQLGLRLDDLRQAEAPHTAPLYFFGGAPYPVAEAAADFAQIYFKLNSDLNAAPAPTLYNHSTPRGRELDQWSILDWIERNVPGGLRSRLGELLNVAYTIEYGTDSGEQSALNLLYLLGYAKRNGFPIFGESDERYHIRGGNDLVVSRLASAVEGQVVTDHELVAIAREADSALRLTFKEGDATRTVRADAVVLALPFSILRASVDFRQAGFSALKETAIRELGMGTNSKLQLQFTSRYWESRRCSGETFSDTGAQATWDASRAQPGHSGLLVNFTGGAIGAGMNQGTAEERARQFLRQMEPALPGLTGQWNGKAVLDYWTGNRWSRGSYSFWKVGQYTRFAGIESEPEGNCYFCGEHTSINSQGFLNGAIETGARAAREILKAVAGRRRQHA